MQNHVTAFQDALDTRFFAPLRRTRTRRIGVELEFPVWSRTPGTATDFAAVHAATDDFLYRFPFSAQGRDDEGNIYRATDPDTGDELSFDCSYNTLEISFGPDENLTKTHHRFTTYYTALQESLADVMGYLESTSIYCVERFDVLYAMVAELSRGNKLNLLIYDGEILYAHCNFRDTLHVWRDESAVAFSTRPLSIGTWEPMPFTSLVAAKNGEIVRTSPPHGNEYIYNPNDYRMVYMEFAGL